MIPSILYPKQLALSHRFLELFILFVNGSFHYLCVIYLFSSLSVISFYFHLPKDLQYVDKASIILVKLFVTINEIFYDVTLEEGFFGGLRLEIASRFCL